MVAKLPYSPLDIHKPEPSVDFAGLYRILLQQKKLIAAIVGAFVAVAVLYIATTTRLYTAQSRVLLDPLKAEVFSDLRSADSSLRFSSAMMESQVEVIGSPTLAIDVLKALKDPAYLEAEKAGDREKMDELVDETVDALQASRVGESYVIALNYTSKSPTQAAEFSNAYAKAYLAGEIRSLKDVSDGSLEKMKSRLAELRQQMTEARMRVQAFQTDNNLYEIDGKMISDEQLQALNFELSNAKNLVASRKARLEFSKRVITEKDLSAALASALDNDVINNIRNQYLTSKKKLAELTRTLGQEHQAVKLMRHEVQEYESIIENEMRRSMQNDANELSVAEAREKDLQEQLDTLLQRRALVNAKKSELKGLESEATVFENLYSQYLDKLQQTSEKAALPITDSRIITIATPPAKPSHPKSLLILVAAIFVGSGVAVVAAMYRGLTNETIRTTTDIERLDLRFLGTFPFVNFIEQRKQRRRVNKKEFRFDSPVYSVAINDLLSPQAETIRRIRAVLDGASEDVRTSANSGMLIGIVSCHTGEGKTTLASNIALSLANSGCKTLLIDADVKNSRLRHTPFINAPMGLGNVLSDEIDEETAMVTEARTGLHILTNIGKDPSETLKMYHKERLKVLLNKVREKYTYVIVDLPPLIEGAEVFIFNRELDRFFVVVETGRTEISDLSNALAQNEISSSKVLGVVLNKL
jgi:succinoglycan biosynthesis transport protein ExoP